MAYSDERSEPTTEDLAVMREVIICPDCTFAKACVRHVNKRPDYHISEVQRYRTNTAEVMRPDREDRLAEIEWSLQDDKGLNIRLLVEFENDELRFAIFREGGHPGDGESKIWRPNINQYRR